MKDLFEQQKALFTEQMNWYTGQVTKTTETLVADAEKAAKGAHEAWSELAERQMGIAVEFGKQAQGFVEKQIKLVEQAFSPAA